MNGFGNRIARDTFEIFTTKEPLPQTNNSFCREAKLLGTQNLFESTYPIFWYFDPTTRLPVNLIKNSFTWRREKRAILMYARCKRIWITTNYLIQKFISCTAQLVTRLDYRSAMEKWLGSISPCRLFFVRVIVGSNIQIDKWRRLNTSPITSLIFNRAKEVFAFSLARLKMIYRLPAQLKIQRSLSGRV